MSKEKILILANNDMGLYRFRKELIEVLLKKEIEVYICMPYGPYVDKFENMGCRYLECNYLERRGSNPIHDLHLLWYYQKILKKIRPDKVFTYTIKPNVYGGIACGKLKIPYVANVTGLGSAIQNGGIMSWIALTLYKLGLKKAQKVFFQNQENLNYIMGRKIYQGEYDLLPGSGVNLDENPIEEYPIDNGRIVFLVIGRLMKDKGTDEVLEAARILKGKHSNVCVRLVGPFDDNYAGKVQKYIDAGYVECLGKRDDVHELIKNSHATIHASYHEGMSNVLQETAASGRPVIATNISGCKEIFEDGVSGFVFEPGNVASLVNAVEKFLSLSYDKKRLMGINARKKMEDQFDRRIVIEKYIKEL